MKKLIAKTTKGTEYIYSIHNTYQANQSKINLICAALNKAKYRLKDNELYKVYVVADYTYKQAAYKLIYKQNKLSVYEIWNIYN